MKNIKQNQQNDRTEELSKHKSIYEKQIAEIYESHKAQRKQAEKQSQDQINQISEKLLESQTQIQQLNQESDKMKALIIEKTNKINEFVITTNKLREENSQLQKQCKEMKAEV